MKKSEFIKKRLEEIGMTQSELAIRSGVTPSHISLLIRGKRDVMGASADFYFRLCRALKTLPETFEKMEDD